MKIIILTDTKDEELIAATKKLFRTVFSKVIVKPIPEKLDESTGDRYNIGYNGCLNDLEKEDEYD